MGQIIIPVAFHGSFDEENRAHGQGAVGAVKHNLTHCEHLVHIGYSVPLPRRFRRSDHTGRGCRGGRADRSRKIHVGKSKEYT